MRYIREMDFSNALYLRLFIKFAKWNKKNKFYLASWTSFSLVLKYIKNYSSLMMDYFRRIYSFFFNIIYMLLFFVRWFRFYTRFIFNSWFFTYYTFYCAITFNYNFYFNQYELCTSKLIRRSKFSSWNVFENHAFLKFRKKCDFSSVKI